MNLKNKIKPMKGKKSQVELVMVVAIFTLILILVIFMGLKDRGREEEAQRIVQSLNDQGLLIAYLRTPVNAHFDDFTALTISDLISYSHKKDDYDLLEEKTTEVLEDYFGKEVCWKMEVGGEELENTDECMGEDKISLEAPIPPVFGSDKTPLSFSMEVW